MFAIKNMDCVISMNRDMTSWLVLEGVNPGKIALVNNFVDVDAISNVASSCAAQVNGDICNVGLFCNFVPAKRISDVIKSVHKVVTHYGNESIHLHLAGHGPLYGEMRRLVSNSKIDAFCSFYGFLDEPLPLMAKMDIVILASVTEGVPRCLMEALSLGKTVISSEISGVRELVIDRQTGYLFKLGDVDGLAKLIDFIARNNSYLPSSTLVEFMKKNFDVKICGCLLLAEIKKVFEQKKYVRGVAPRKPDTYYSRE
jgi:glycosyltransferase involved in cell wall biosynthesis